MTSTIWDYCQLDEETLKLIDQIKQEQQNDGEIAPRGSSSSAASSLTVVSSSGAITPSPFVGNNGSTSGIDDLQASLVKSESSCRAFLTELDSILGTLGEVSNLYDDVTGRTNSLMMNCENLLEQQVGRAKKRTTVDYRNHFLHATNSFPHRCHHSFPPHQLFITAHVASHRRSIEGHPRTVQRDRGGGGSPWYPFRCARLADERKRLQPRLLG